MTGVSGLSLVRESVVAGGRSALRTVAGALWAVGVAVGIGVVGDSSGEDDSGRETTAEREPDERSENERSVGAQSPAAAAASPGSPRWRRTYSTKFSKTPLASQAAR